MTLINDIAGRNLPLIYVPAMRRMALEAIDSCFLQSEPGVLTGVNFADEGRNKAIFKVSYATRDGDVHWAVALNKAVGREAFAREFAKLRWLYEMLPEYFPIPVGVMHLGRARRSAMVMEYLRGKKFDEFCEENSRLTAESVRALGVAAGRVYRLTGRFQHDASPENFLVCNKGDGGVYLQFVDLDKFEEGRLGELISTLSDPVLGGGYVYENMQEFLDGLKRGTTLQ